MKEKVNPIHVVLMRCKSLASWLRCRARDAREGQLAELDPLDPDRLDAYAEAVDQLRASHCAMSSTADSYRGEAQSYREALQMIAQIIHGSTRTTHMIAEAALAGADFTDPDVAMKVAEGKWRKP